MRKLRLKNLFKYTLAVVCVCCAMIAGVFSLQKNNAKAEEIITTTNISIDSIALDNTVSAGYSSHTVAVSATIKGDVLDKFNAGDFDVDFKYQYGQEYLYEESPKGEVFSTKKYYMLSVYPGESEEDKNSSFDTLNNNHFMRCFTNGTTELLNNTKYTVIGENFIFYLPMTHVSVMGEFDIISKTTEYTWFIDVWEVTETELIDSYNLYTHNYFNKWSVESTKKTYEYNKVYSSNNQIKTSIKDLARNQLSALASDSTADVDWLFNYAGLPGISAETQIDVNLNYKKFDENKLNLIVNTTEIKKIPARIMFNNEEVINYVYRLIDKKSLVDFNCNLVEKYYENGKVFESGSRVYLQAESISSTYVDELGIVEVNVNYTPFEYKDFYIKIFNNQPGNNLTINYYAPEVSSLGNQIMLVFNFSKIQEHLFNSASWSFALEKRNFTIDDAPDGVYVTLTDDSLSISFEKENAEKLLNFKVSVVSEIYEDVPYSFTYTYVRLSDSLVETKITSTPIEKIYSELIGISSETFYDEYGVVIDNAISPSSLGEEMFYSYVGFYPVYNHEKKTCNFVVTYRYNTLLKLESDLSNIAKYITLSKNSTLYTYDDLELDSFIPDGYRIKNITGNKDVAVSFDAENTKDTTFTINYSSIHEKKIIPIKFDFTDKWNIVINYLEQYKNTPFAVYKTITKEIKVSDYEDVRLITDEQVAKLLGFKNLYLFPIENTTKYMTHGFVLREKDEHGNSTAYADSAKLKFDGESKYTLTLEYSYAVMRKINSNGIGVEEIKVPLTCYEDWCNQFNQDWSIMYLNRKDATWFDYTDEVPENKLYGFFNIATFEERKSNLNDIFAEFTSDGCKVVYEAEEVSGDGLYKFYYNMLGTVWHVPGVIGMFYQEWGDLILSPENRNKILYSYFFYLDCSTSENYLSQSGAENWNDKDSSTEKEKDKILGLLNRNSLKDWWENSWFAQFLKVLGIGIICGVALYIFVRIFQKLRR